MFHPLFSPSGDSYCFPLSHTSGKQTRLRPPDFSTIHLFAVDHSRSSHTSRRVAKTYDVGGNPHLFEFENRDCWNFGCFVTLLVFEVTDLSGKLFCLYDASWSFFQHRWVSIRSFFKDKYGNLVFWHRKLIEYLWLASDFKAVLWNYIFIVKFFFLIYYNKFV